MGEILKEGVHDAGYTYANLLALGRGLGDSTKAYKVFDWLDNGTAEATVGGGHVGSTNIYQLVVAPRSTARVPNADWHEWSMPGRNEDGGDSMYPYGRNVEDGMLDELL